MFLSEVIPTITMKLAEKADCIPIGIRQITVFGSHARGTATLRSDIDLALIYDKEVDEAKSDRAVMYDLLSDVVPEIEITLFGTTFEKIANAHECKTANYGIRREGVMVWEASTIKM